MHILTNCSEDEIWSKMDMILQMKYKKDIPLKGLSGVHYETAFVEQHWFELNYFHLKRYLYVLHVHVEMIYEYLELKEI